jgi:xanthine dehydrogenase accessory factor
MTPLQFYQQLIACTHKAERWCVASVVQTRGSTPRKKGAQMAVALDAGGKLIAAIASIGGGAGEAKVLRAAAALLSSADKSHETLEIDLSGQAVPENSAFEAETATSGVCGGYMRLCLSTFTAPDLSQRAQAINDTLKAGKIAISDPVTLLPANHNTHETLRFLPAPICLIGGGGHCGVALAELLVRLGFPVAVIDERDEVFGCVLAPELEITEFSDWAGALASLKIYQAHGAPAATAVLLSRSYRHDLTALHAIAQSEVEFSLIGMMGSARRIRVVKQQLGQFPAALIAVLRAPIGLNIGAETPSEIAVSIAAELLSLRSALAVRPSMSASAPAKSLD